MIFALACIAIMCGALGFQAFGLLGSLIGAALCLSSAAIGSMIRDS